MTHDRFSAEDFAASLDRYGADLAQWPASVRATGATWLVTHPEARQLLQQAEKIAHSLKKLTEPLPMDSRAHSRLMAKITARQHAQRPAAFFDFSPRLALASFAVAALVFSGGIWAGDHLGVLSAPEQGAVIAFNMSDEGDADQDIYLDALITGEI